MTKKNLGNRLLKRLIAIAVVIAVVLGFKFYRKSQYEKEVVSASQSVIQEIPGYQNNAAQFNELFGTAHEIAFDQTYKMGGRRQGASMEGGQYMGFLLGVMQQIADREGKTEIRDAIRSFSKDRGIRVVTIENLDDVL